MCAASSVPSSAKAILASPCSWRAWPAAMRFSRRSSIHFTAAGSLRAASIRHMSSRSGLTFWPKPPPVSRMITRIRCSSSPRSREQKARTSWGAWVAGPDRQLPARPLDDDPPGLHRHRRVGLLVDRLGDDVGRRRTRLVHRLGLAAPQVARDVALVALVHELAGPVGLDVVGHVGQWVVVDVDQFGRVLGDVAVLGHHQRDRIAHEADLALGQRRPGRVGDRPCR